MKLWNNIIWHKWSPSEANRIAHHAKNASFGGSSFRTGAERAETNYSDQLSGQRGEALLWLITGHSFSDYDQYYEDRNGTKRGPPDREDVPGFPFDSKCTEAWKEDLQVTMDRLSCVIQKKELHQELSYAQAFHYPKKGVTFFVGWIKGKEILPYWDSGFEGGRYVVPNRKLHGMGSWREALLSGDEK